MAQMMAEFMEGKIPEVPYTLDDMAADGVSLLDALDIERAHICGASMGGMIVQAMAINHGDRISVPTLIIHGTDDCLDPVEGGIDTHESIRNSELMLIEGMGHDLPVGAWNRIVEGVSSLTRSQD